MSDVFVVFRSLTICHESIMFVSSVRGLRALELLSSNCRIVLVFAAVFYINENVSGVTMLFILWSLDLQTVFLTQLS